MPLDNKFKPRLLIRFKYILFWNLLSKYLQLDFILNQNYNSYSIYKFQEVELISINF